ncbi:hypothetical protein T492DRAFT_983610 [Pavlovales sp. CCMP2436]|nr:hypothetical protein T492DRAFT_983610 [Pavlovales sp. CCMP2436]
MLWLIRWVRGTLSRRVRWQARLCSAGGDELVSAVRERDVKVSRVDEGGGLLGVVRKRCVKLAGSRRKICVDDHQLIQNITSRRRFSKLSLERPPSPVGRFLSGGCLLGPSERHRRIALPSGVTRRSTARNFGEAEAIGTVSEKQRPNAITAAAPRISGVAFAG